MQVKVEAELKIAENRGWRVKGEGEVGGRG